MQLLRFVTRELEDCCVMVVGCYRDVELSGQADEPRAESMARDYLGRATAASGDAPAARLDLPALLASAERLRDRGQIVNAFARNAEILFFTGDWEAALDTCDRALALPCAQPYLLSIRAMLGYERGDFAESWFHMEGLAGFVSRASAENTGVSMRMTRSGVAVGSLDQ